MGLVSELAEKAGRNKQYWLETFNKFYLSICVVILVAIGLFAEKGEAIKIIVPTAVAMYALKAWVKWLFNHESAPAEDDPIESVKKLGLMMIENLHKSFAPETAKPLFDFIIEMFEHDDELLISVVTDLNISFIISEKEGLSKLAGYLVVLVDKARDGELSTHQVELIAKYKTVIEAVFEIIEKEAA